MVFDTWKQEGITLPAHLGTASCLALSSVRLAALCNHRRGPMRALCQRAKVSCELRSLHPPGEGSIDVVYGPGECHVTHLIDAFSLAISHICSNSFLCATTVTRTTTCNPAIWHDCNAQVLLEATPEYSEVRIIVGTQHWWPIWCSCPLGLSLDIVIYTCMCSAAQTCVIMLCCQAMSMKMLVFATFAGCWALQQSLQHGTCR